jgi:hypothetical protein
LKDDRLRDQDALTCQMFGREDVKVLVLPELQSKTLKVGAWESVGRTLGNITYGSKDSQHELMAGVGVGPT